jgi:murein DD-endopeptidase MepM/ murein hydrolase activator NlpD
MTLDDVQSMTGLGDLTLPAIAEQGGVPQNLPLSYYPLVLNQRMQDLVRTNAFNNTSVSAMPAVAQALERANLPAGWQNRTLPQLLQQNPQQLNQIGTLGQSLGPAAAQLTLSAISPLLSTAVQRLAGSGAVKISQLPGASNIPLANMPQGNAPISEGFARIDMVWSNAERQRPRTVSGSNIVGFRVPCQGNCASIEIDDLENMGMPTSPVEGAHWIGGQQLVPGGIGPLKAVGGGMEPTGRILDKEGMIKMVIFPQESQGLVQMGLFFRKCGPPGCQANATPYIFGPTMILSFKENSLIPMGANFEQEMTSAANNPGAPIGGGSTGGSNPMSSTTQNLLAAAPGVMPGGGGNPNNPAAPPCTPGNTVASLSEASNIATQTVRPAGNPAVFAPKPTTMPTDVASYLPGGSSANQWLSTARLASAQVDPATGLPYDGDPLTRQTLNLQAVGVASRPNQVLLANGQPLTYYSDAGVENYNLNSSCTVAQMLDLYRVGETVQQFFRDGNAVPSTAACPNGLRSCPLQNPLPNMSMAGVYSGFRRPSRPSHNGIDIQSRLAQTRSTNNPAIPGDRVVAAASGSIVFAEYGDNGGFGNFIQISHPQHGLQTEYAHLFSITPGLKTKLNVSVGTQIGVEGTTGRSQGIHLHYQIRDKGHLANPYDYPHKDPPFRCTVSGGCT